MNFKFLIAFTFLTIFNATLFAEQSNKEISFYTGIFDTIDKEGDDKSQLFGVEHRNPNLYRSTLLGKFAPVTGAFITKNEDRRR